MSLIPMPAKFFATARRYGELVVSHSELPGSHCTHASNPSFNTLSHIKGKYGELAFLKWCMSSGLVPSHTPFRHDYRQKCPDDDFIVNGHRVEVKAKRRGVRSPFPPLPTFAVHVGKVGLDAGIYVWLEIDPHTPFEDGPACHLIGWGDADLIRAKGQRVAHGSISAGSKFTWQRPDWQVLVADLRPAETLLPLLHLPPCA
jgi:hypothetical protein